MIHIIKPNTPAVTENLRSLSFFFDKLCSNKVVPQDDAVFPSPVLDQVLRLWAAHVGQVYCKGPKTDI